MTARVRGSAQTESRTDAATSGTKPSASYGRVAYLINQYPKISHSFIRREILALERNGVHVERIAVRGFDAEVVDPEDKRERDRTRYILKRGAVGLLASMLRRSTKSPGRFWQALKMAMRLARSSERSWPFHIIYLAEACCALDWLEESGVTHLHAHFGTNPAEVALLVRLLGGPPYSFTAHGTDEMDGGTRLGLKEKLHHAKFAVGVSAFTRSQLYRRTDPVDWAKVKVVHCGLDSDFLAVPAVDLPANNRLICVGRLSEEKGQVVLLEALARVRNRGIDCDLVLAGDGPMRPVIERSISALGLVGHVRITGWLTGEEVRGEILGSRALVCSSFMEGLPVVIMEAMALRRPVIASAISGIPELIRPGQTGWLAAAGDPEALAGEIGACLSASQSELEAIRETAYETVRSRHSVDREARKLAQLFLRPVDAKGIEEWRP